MITQIFNAVLRTALTSSMLIAAAVAIRFAVSRRAPKSVACLIWAVVALRLALPFEIQTGLSVVPRPAVEAEKQFSGFVSGAGTFEAPAGAAAAAETAIPAYKAAELACAVWIAGAAALLIYAAVNVFLIRRKLAESVPSGGNVRKCDRISSPFVWGLFKPKIYMPFGLDPNTESCVLLHEKAHIKRLDNITKPLWFAVCAVYWFDPLVWISYMLFCHDIEYACDESVCRGKSDEFRRNYGKALFGYSGARFNITFNPAAFGELAVKSRIKRALGFKRAGKPAAFAAAALIVAAAICLATDPVGSAVTAVVPDKEEPVGAVQGPAEADGHLTPEDVTDYNQRLYADSGKKYIVIRLREAKDFIENGTNGKKIGSPLKIWLLNGGGERIGYVYSNTSGYARFEVGNDFFGVCFDGDENYEKSVLYNYINAETLKWNSDCVFDLVIADKSFPRTVVRVTDPNGAPVSGADVRISVRGDRYLYAPVYRTGSDGVAVLPPAVTALKYNFDRPEITVKLYGYTLTRAEVDFYREEYEIQLEW